jgi:hypothetical protein
VLRWYLLARGPDSPFYFAQPRSRRETPFNISKYIYIYLIWYILLLLSLSQSPLCDALSAVLLPPDYRSALRVGADDDSKTSSPPANHRASFRLPPRTHRTSFFPPVSPSLLTTLHLQPLHFSLFILPSPLRSRDSPRLSLPYRQRLRALSPAFHRARRLIHFGSPIIVNPISESWRVATAAGLCKPALINEPRAARPSDLLLINHTTTTTATNDGRGGHKSSTTPTTDSRR